MTVGNSRSKSKVLLGFTSLSGSLNKKSVFSARSTNGELVQSDDLSSSLQNSSTSGLGYFQSSESELGDLIKSSIISDSSEGDDDLSGVALLGEESGDTGNRQGRAESAGHKETLQNDVVELLAGSTSQVRVDLGEDADIRIFTTRGSAPRFTVVLMINVNTHGDWYASSG